VTVGLAGLAYGFTAAPRSSFSDPWIIASLAVGGAALAAFVTVELRHPNPMVPLRLFRVRTFAGTNLLTFFLYGGLYGYTVFFSLALIQGQGYRESLAGLASMPFIVVLAILSRWAGKLVDRVGPRLPLVAGPAIVAIGFALHAAVGLTSGPSQYWTTYFPAVALAGLGMGITVAPLTATVMTSVDDRHAGAASGINNATSRIGGVLAVAVLGSAALFAFAGAVQEQAAALGLPQQALDELRLQTARFGRAEVPDAVSAEMRGAVALLLRRSFVDTCRLMMLLCAGLAVAAAGLSWLMVEGPRDGRRQAQAPG
jgi:MFS family permease